MTEQIKTIIDDITLQLKSKRSDARGVINR